MSYLASLRPASRKRMLGSLKLGLRYLAPGFDNPPIFDYPWHTLNADKVEQLLGLVHEQYPDGPSAGLLATALKQVTRRLARSGEMDPQVWAQIQTIKNPRNGSRTAANMYRLTRADILALAETLALDGSAAGARDAAIVAILLSTGLRIGSVAALDLGHVDLDTGHIQVVSAKGGRQGRCRISGESLRIVRHWAIRWRGPRPGPLLVPISRSDRVAAGDLFSEPRRLKTGPIAKTLRRRCRAAGLSEEITAHSFRRHYITAGIKKGVDLAILQRAAFHANVSTTAAYSQIDDSEVLEAVANVAQYPKIN